MRHTIVEQVPHKAICVHFNRVSCWATHSCTENTKLLLSWVKPPDLHRFCQYQSPLSSPPDIALSAVYAPPKGIIVDAEQTAPKTCPFIVKFNVVFAKQSHL
jgi:hypothetical protein